MKKIYLSIIIISLSLKALCQSPGSLDALFNLQGTASFFVPMETLPQLSCKHLVQPDGKIVICSNSIISFGVAEIMVTRLNSDGSIDLSFGNSGTFNFPIVAGLNLAVGLQLQTDGKIVTSGIFNDGTGINNNEVFILRLYTNGTLDSTFGNAGISKWNFTPENERVTDLKLMNDASFAISGYIQSSNSSDSCFIIKVNSIGGLDSSFAVNGIFKYQHLGNQTDLYSLDVLSDKSIIAAGSYSSLNNYQDIFIIKLDSLGMFDSSFANSGIYTKDVFNDYDEIHSMQVLLNGDILFAGYSYNGNNDGSLVLKLDSIGSEIMSFGVNGITNYTFSNTPSRSYAMDIQSNGKIVLAGEYADTVSGLYNFMLLRLLANGMPDTSFNFSLPYVITDYFMEDDHSSSVAIQSDNKILVYGTAIYNTTTQEALPSLARYLGGETTSVGIDIILNNSFSNEVYPNPFTTLTTIEFNEPETQNVSITIIDVVGREIKCISVNNFQQVNNKITIDLSELKNGIYYGLLKHNGKIKSFKLVKK